MKKGVSVGKRLFCRNSVLGEMLFEVVYGESYSFFGERLAQMFRVILLEAAGAQISTEKRVESSTESLTEGVGYLHHIFLFHPASSAAYADEHERSFHKAALGTETSAAVQTDGRIEHLLVYFYIELSAETDEGGDGAVVVLVVIEMVDEFVMVAHGKSRGKMVTEGGTPVRRCRQGCERHCSYPGRLPDSQGHA